jgi:hypothetical protein
MHAKVASLASQWFDLESPDHRPLGVIIGPHGAGKRAFFSSCQHYGISAAHGRMIQTLFTHFSDMEGWSTKSLQTARQLISQSPHRFADIMSLNHVRDRRFNPLDVDPVTRTLFSQMMTRIKFISLWSAISIRQLYEIVQAYIPHRKLVVFYLLPPHYLYAERLKLMHRSTLPWVRRLKNYLSGTSFTYPMMLSYYDYHAKASLFSDVAYYLCHSFDTISLYRDVSYATRILKTGGSIPTLSEFLSQAMANSHSFFLDDDDLTNMI